MERSRRVFVSTGVAFVGVGAAGLTIPFVRNNTVSAAPMKPDTVLAELGRQSLEALRTVNRAALPTGEPSRQLAEALRVFAAHAHTTKLDVKFMTALRQMRNLELRGHPVPRADLSEAFEMLEKEGLHLDANRFGGWNENPALRQEAYAQFLTRGAVPTWLAVAEAFEAASVMIDRRRGIQLIRQQTPPACPEWSRIAAILEVTMILARSYGFPVPEFCFIARVDYITWRLMMLAIGC